MTTRLMGSVAIAGLILSVAACGSATPAATGTPATTAQTDMPAITTPDNEATGPHTVVASFPIPGNGAPLGEAGTGRPCVSWDAPPAAD